MGKGDKKTRKGKITQGSYGKTRPKKSSESVIPAKEEKPKKEVAPKAEKPKKTEKSTGEVVEEKPKTKRRIRRSSWRNSWRKIIFKNFT